MEPEFTKQIPSSTVCNFFYIFFVVYAVIAVLALLTTVGLFSMTKKMGGAGIAGGIGYLLMMALAATQALFFYLICDRSLLKGAVEAFVAKH
jgi:uncharacterized membrane protein